MSSKNSENQDSDVLQKPQLKWGEFFTALVRKGMVSFVSMKLWAFWLYFIVSTYYMHVEMLDASTWAYTNLSALGLVFGMREVAKSNVKRPRNIEEEPPEISSMYI